MISQEYLLANFRYEPETGRFYRHGQDTEPGCIVAEGYRHIAINKRIYKAHRLAWLYYYGDWPKGKLDHVNGDRADNRIDNLRLASDSQNAMNTRLRSGNRAGFKGVSFDRGRYSARIKADGKIKRLGRFLTAEEAHEAYCKAAEIYFGEFARTK